MHKNILSALVLGVGVLLAGCDNDKQCPESTINPEIQQIFSEHLSAAADKYQTKSIVGLIMETKTGNIIAQINPESALDLYEFGSVFKVFNTALAIENGLEDKEYTVNEPYSIYDKSGNPLVKIIDVASFKPATPTMSVSDILKHSCNVGSAQIALDLPKEAQQTMFEKLRFNDRVVLDFGTTRQPRLPDKWNEVNRAQLSFGSGAFVSPVHMIAAVNAMVNDGVYVYPTTNKCTKAPKSERIINKSTSEKLRNIMYQIVEETSGRKAKIDSVKIGGKTGTAQKYSSEKSDDSRVLTSFVSFFPVDDSQYTMLIVFDEPSTTDVSFGLKTAAWNVVPVGGEILKEIVPILIK